MCRCHLHTCVPTHMQAHRNVKKKTTGSSHSPCIHEPSLASVHIFNASMKYLQILAWPGLCLCAEHKHIAKFNVDNKPMMSALLIPVLYMRRIQFRRKMEASSGLT